MSVGEDSGFPDLDEIDQRVKEFYDEVFNTYVNLVRPLRADVREAATAMKEDDSLFARRSYLRAVFALFEGELFASRTTILQNIRYIDENTSLRLPLTDAERTLLKEVEFSLDDDGNFRMRNRFQPHLAYLRFTVEVLCRYRGKPCAVDFTGQGWQAYRAAHAIRNRIMHPRRLEDLFISDDEVIQIKLATRWFDDAMSNI